MTQYKNLPIHFSIRSFCMAMGATSVLLAAFWVTAKWPDISTSHGATDKPFTPPSVVAEIVDLLDKKEHSAPVHVTKVTKKADHAAAPVAEGHEEHAAAENAATENAATENAAADHLPEKAHTESTSLPDKDLPHKEKHSVEDMLAGLHETKPEGMIPMMRADGVTPYQSYQQVYTAAANTKAIIALVMVDFGLSAKASQSALNQLPSGVSFSVSPYAENAQKWVSEARSFGHEVWMSIPVQPTSFPDIDPGAYTILTSSGEQQKQHRLYLSLGKATGYAGVMGLIDPSTTRAKIDTDYILREVGSRGLGYIESDIMDNKTMPLARALKLPSYQANMWLDNQPDPTAIQENLAALEKEALQKQKALALFRPTPVTIKLLQPWMNQMKEKGIEIVPVSAVIEAK